MSQSTLHWLLVGEAHTWGGPPKVLGSYSARMDAEKAQADWGGRLLELEFEEQHDRVRNIDMMVFFEWLQPE